MLKDLFEWPSKTFSAFTRCKYKETVGPYLVCRFVMLTLEAARHALLGASADSPRSSLLGTGDFDF